MGFNRNRCFSAEAGIPSQHQAAYYNFPIADAVNRHVCATVSPPGMTRVHEDRPNLFTNNDKERLAMPPLSEPRPLGRPRLHTTGGLGNSFSGLTASVSVPNIDTSAFVPVHTGNQQFAPQSPPPFPSHNRAKLTSGDRACSSGSNGDLPSSMAEAVLASITSSAPAGGGMIGTSLFASTKGDGFGEAPFLVASSESSDTPSALRLGSSESTSLFSGGEPTSIFSRAEKPVPSSAFLGTNSWTEENLSYDFTSLLHVAGPPMRNRAATAPAVSAKPLVSRIDPEHSKGEGPHLMPSLLDTTSYQSNSRQL